MVAIASAAARSINQPCSVRRSDISVSLLPVLQDAILMPATLFCYAQGL